MASVPIPNCALVEFRYDIEAQQCENTLYVTNEAGWSADALTGLASNMRDWWSGSLATMIHPIVKLREVVCSDLHDAAGAQVAITGGGLAGTLAGTALPANVAFCISFRSGLRGRSFRGRNYVPGMIQENQETPSTLVGAFVDDLIVVYSGLLTAVFPSGQQWVVASRFADGAPRVTGVTTPVASVVATDRVFDSMRTRLPGRGA